MKFTSTILPLAFVLLAVHINLSHQKSRSFGESCSSSERCDPQRGTISCNTESQKCECRDKATMVYEEESGECVSVEGAPCFTRLVRNRNVRNCIAGTTCVPSSSKSTFGTCLQSQESEDNELEVVLEKEVVNEEQEEDLFADSTTTEENTKTDSTQTSEAATDSTQTSEAATDSTQTSEAATDSTQSTEENTGPTQSTEENTGPTDLPTTTVTEKPLAGHGEACTATSECIANAECNEEEQKCRCGGNFLPQEANQRCARKVDIECTASEECVANAHCMETTKKCMCNEDKGYTEKDGACAAQKVDAECDKNDSVCLAENSACVVQEGFTNGTCQCVDNLKPTEDKLKCSSSVMHAINFSLFIVLLSSNYIFNKFNH